MPSDYSKASDSSSNTNTSAELTADQISDTEARLAALEEAFIRVGEVHVAKLHERSRREKDFHMKGTDLQIMWKTRRLLSDRLERQQKAQRLEASGNTERAAALKARDAAAHSLPEPKVSDTATTSISGNECGEMRAESNSKTAHVETTHVPANEVIDIPSSAKARPNYTSHPRKRVKHGKRAA